MLSKKNRVLSTIIAVLLVFVFVLSGCGQKQVGKQNSAKSEKQGSQLIVTDFAKREVAIPDEVKKVVDLSMHHATCTLIELGREDLLVGVSQRIKDLYDPNGKMKIVHRIVPKAAPCIAELQCVGSDKEPNIEVIMSLKPDIIFMDCKDEYADLVQEQTGIPVVCINVIGGHINFDVTRLVAKVIGEEEKAEKLIAFAEEKLKKITDVTSKIPEDEKVKVFLWTVPKDIKVQEAKTIGFYDPIEFAGGKNVANSEKLTPFKPWNTSKEQITIWNPDIIIKHSWTSPKNAWMTIDDIISDPVLQSVKAIKNKKVYIVRSYMRGGLDPAEGIAEVYYLAKLFYPERFKDLNVEKENNEILKRFYNVDGLYDEMVEMLGLYSWKW